MSSLFFLFLIPLYVDIVPRTRNKIDSGGYCISMVRKPSYDQITILGRWMKNWFPSRAPVKTFQKRKHPRNQIVPELGPFWIVKFIRLDILKNGTLPVPTRPEEYQDNGSRRKRVPGSGTLPRKSALGGWAPDGSPDLIKRSRSPRQSVSQPLCCPSPSLQAATMR